MKEDVFMPYCVNCGNKLDDDAIFCTACGTKQNAGAPAAPAAAPQPAPEKPPKSTWDGGVWATFGMSLLASLLTIVTCGIALPWAMCMVWRFIIRHIVVDGKRLKFDGKGGQLFGKWLLWCLLCVVTCGIYSLWVTPKFYKWIASHTHFE